MQELYLIQGREDSELSGMVFGTFTSEELADKGYSFLPEEIREEMEIIKSSLPLNSVDVDGKHIQVA